MEDTKVKDGMYRSNDAIYYIKDGRILMNMKGSWYKTNANFLQGPWLKPLTSDQLGAFDKAYSQVKSW